ncbi:MAG: hypothetical protein DME26_20590 [Verrucomicrobia bacterium]|nr:MAG: hypothetical protein DME26_20590 [Verrucomicrobiota bacterium]
MDAEASQLNHRVSNALNESRTLILGAEVLLGFQFRSVFESGFAKLPAFSQYLSLYSLGALLIVLGLLIAPAAYHRVVERGEDSEALYCFTTGAMSWALLPFAVGLAINVYIVTGLLSGGVTAIAAGVGAIITAFVFWYGLEWLVRRRRGCSRPKCRGMKSIKPSTETARTDLADKVDHVLTEARLVLPGVQALLGFQLATVLLDRFEKLPVSSKYIHLISLGLITICTIFLMTPAAYHRLVEQGEDSERFHRFATHMVLAAMVPLALGVSGDTYLVVQTVTGSAGVGLGVSILTLGFFLGLWFGLTLYLRRQHHKHATEQTAG